MPPAKARPLRPRRVEGLGWRPSPPDVRDLIYKPEGVATPDLIDLEPGCPPVYAQLQLGSCTANAAAGAFEFELLKQGLPDFMPSRLFIYYAERVLENSVGYDSGACCRDSVKVLALQGVCNEALWPYNTSAFTEMPPKECWTEAALNRATQYLSVSQDQEAIESCLAAGYPIIFGFTVYESFMNVGPDGLVPMPGASEHDIGGHATLIVGYDRIRRLAKVRNSWGLDWGLGGYFLMPYDYVLDPSLADDFWSLRMVTEQAA